MTHCVGGRLGEWESTEDRRTRNAGPRLGLSINSVGKEAEKYELRTSLWKSAGEGAQQTVENSAESDDWAEDRIWVHFRLPTRIHYWLKRPSLLGIGNAIFAIKQNEVFVGGAREAGGCLMALGAFAEDPDSVPSTDMVSASRSRESDPLDDLHGDQAHTVQMDTCRQNTHAQKVN